MTPFDIFYDENQNLVFQQILSESRLMALAESELELKETLLFCFTHVKNQKRYFYSATREELAQSTELMQLFIGFGSHKPSWQVFKLQLSDSSEADAYQPLSIPDSASEEVRKSNRPPSPRVLAMLKDLKYIATLTPLSNATTATQYQKQYNYDRSKVSQLSQFGHPKLKRYISINVETVEYVNLRSEDRYLYKTKIELTKTDQNEHFSGSTRDFSLHGLQVVADKPMPYKKGDILLLAMPDFQKLTKAMKLDALPYEVMAISKDRTIVNLRTFEPTGHHPGREFIGKVISQNRSKLTPAEMESRFPGLSKCLRNLAVRSAANLPLYFAKDGKRLRLTSVGQSNQKQFLLNLLRRHHPENSDVTLYPLIKGKAESAIYAPIMNKLRRTDRPKVLELYLHYRSDMMEEKHAFIAMFDHQIESADEVKDFVHSATSNDIFCAFRIYLSRTGRPDMSYVAKELAYVGSYAIHRAKELEEKLWNIIGLGDLVDISDELMVRHGISQEQIDRQHALKNQLLS